MSKKKTNEEILDIMEHVDVTKEAEAARESIFHTISERIGMNAGSHKNIRFSGKYWCGVAASLILLSGLGYYFYQSGLKSGLKMLTASYIETTNVDGHISSITLPDNSKVTLNRGAGIRYPSHFADNQRGVELYGEAFFDIAKDSLKPFIVHTPGMEVEVLGTRFNLKSLEKDDCLWLTLEEGAVIAKTNVSGNSNEIRLLPNEQVVLNKVTGEISTRKVHTELYTCWLTGNLYFNDHTLEEIALELEKKFNVKIVIRDENVKKETFYCQFSKDDSLERIIRLLSGKSKWKYKISDNQVEIYK